MRFILKLLLCASIYMANIASVMAVEVTDSNTFYRSVIEKLVLQYIEPVIAELPLKQRTRLNDVQISIVENMRAHAMALALDETPPRVLVNARFISDLSAYTEAYQVTQVTARSEFIEHYFHYYFSEISQGVHHTSIVRPVIWAELDKRDIAKVISSQQPVFEGVLLDVLLHELGHHAEKAFYSYRASQAIIEANEALADQWAQSVKLKYMPSINPLGQLISIAFIFERDRWVILSKDNSYPRMLPMIVGRLPSLCRGSLMTIKEFCEHLEDNIGSYMTSRIERAYSERIEQGEDFARFPMAKILLSKNNFVEACNYFNESLIYGQVAGAAIYVGWCYQKGFLENSPPDAEVLAMANLRGGIGYGYNDKIMVEHFF